MAARCLDSRNLSLQPGNREVGGGLEEGWRGLEGGWKGVGGCNRVVGDGAAVFDPVIEL